MGLNVGALLEKEYYHEVDVTAKNVFIDNIVYDMEGVCNGRELNLLNKTLNHILENFDIVDDNVCIDDSDWEYDNEVLIDKFVKIKTLEGLSKNTLEVYTREVNYFLKIMDKSLLKVTTEDIREYLIFLMDVRGVTKNTADNSRRFLNSFFQTLYFENLIKKNPLRKIRRIKVPSTIKKPFSKEELVLMRMNIDNVRDHAIFEMLLSSGVRVAELVNMDISDVNFNDNSIYVIGKGNKERKVYFSDDCKVYLKLYLESRDDNKPALFLQKQRNKGRIGIEGVSTMIRGLGMESGVTKAHCHRFRRTFATEMLNRDVPIEQVSQLLGHESIETTTIYAITNENTVKVNHSKFID